MDAEGAGVGRRTVIRRPANHALHLVLTVLTLGMWAPVWIVCAAVGRRETVTHAPPHYPWPGQPVWNPYTQRWET